MFYCIPATGSRNTNINRWRTKERQLLKEEYVTKLLIWVLTQEILTAEEFEPVIYSHSECGMEKFKESRQQWVFRTSVKKWVSEHKYHKSKSSAVSFVVVGCSLRCVCAGCCWFGRPADFKKRHHKQDFYIINTKEEPNK